MRSISIILLLIGCAHAPMREPDMMKLDDCTKVLRGLEQRYELPREESAPNGAAGWYKKTLPRMLLASSGVDLRGANSASSTPDFPSFNGCTGAGATCLIGSTLGASTINFGSVTGGHDTLNFTGFITFNNSIAVTGSGTIGALGGITLAASGTYSVNGVAIYNNAPTISSGFGTSPAIANSNGTLAFTITVGNPTGASGVIGLPNIATGNWTCGCEDITTYSTTVFRTRMTASTASSCTIGNFNNTPASANWVAGDTLKCWAFADP